jgi:hypothetical protein
LWQEQAQPTSINKSKRPFAFFNEFLEVRSGFIAYIPITIVAICMFCSASWQVFLLNNDSARYQCYALTFWFGSNATALLPSEQCAFLHTARVSGPLHMLPLEYPPLTLLLFSLALLAPLPYYQLAFALLMSLTSVLIYWLLLRYGPRGAALIFALYVLIGAFATAQGRFDLLPAALTLLCILAAERRHWTSAYIALAFGTLIKLYPLLLLPVLFIAEQQIRQRLFTPTGPFTLSALPIQLWQALRSIVHWHWKNICIFFTLVIGVTALFALLNFEGAVISQLSYFVKRPVQIEASASTFLLLTKNFGFPIHIVYTFGSLNIESPFGTITSLLGTVLLALGCILTLLLQWQRKLDMAQASIALLLVFIATGKVFSPQYIIWLMPLLAYTGAFDTFWLLSWGAISALTSFIFTYFYTLPIDPSLIPYATGYIEAVTLRNLLFILVTLAYLFNWFRARQRKSPILLTGKETRPLS